MNAQGAFCYTLIYGHRVSRWSNTRRECDGEGVREQHWEGVTVRVQGSSRRRECDGEGAREQHGECDAEGVREQHRGSAMVRV